MENIGNMKAYSFDEIKDELIGKVGTPKRNEHERKVADALHAYHLGEAIKQARLEQNMTQAALGERIGVGRSRISRIEKGESMTIPTLSRLFRALGFDTASLVLGGSRKIALW